MIEYHLNHQEANALRNYLNPGNSGFTAIRNSLYVDKSVMIDLINRTIDTTASAGQEKQMAGK